MINKKLSLMVSLYFLVSLKNYHIIQLSRNLTYLIKVLCEQTREANKRIKMFFGLCLILFGFGNIVADFHVLFRVRGN